MSDRKNDELLDTIEERLERIEGHLNLLLRAKGFDPDNLPAAPPMKEDA